MGSRGEVTGDPVEQGVVIEVDAGGELLDLNFHPENGSPLKQAEAFAQSNSLPVAVAQPLARRIHSLMNRSHDPNFSQHPEAAGAPVGDDERLVSKPGQPQKGSSKRAAREDDYTLKSSHSPTFVQGSLELTDLAGDDNRSESLVPKRAIEQQAHDGKGYMVSSSHGVSDDTHDHNDRATARDSQGSQSRLHTQQKGFTQQPKGIEDRTVRSSHNVAHRGNYDQAGDDKRQRDNVFHRLFDQSLSKAQKGQEESKTALDEQLHTQWRERFRNVSEVQGQSKQEAQQDCEHPSERRAEGDNPLPAVAQGASAFRKSRKSVHVMKREEEDARECTFAPSISKRSSKIATRMTPSSEQTNDSEEGESFQGSESNDKRSLHERLLERKTRWHFEVKKANAVLNEFDPETGQKMFSPQTGRPPSSHSRNEHCNTFERLHSLASNERGSDSKQTSMLASQKSKPTRKSAQIAGEVRRRRMREIFDVLMQKQDVTRSDNRKAGKEGDEKVCLTDIDLDGLRKDLQHDLNDATIAMGSHPISREEFVQLMESLISMFKRGPRSYLQPSATTQEHPKSAARKASFVASPGSNAGAFRVNDSSSSPTSPRSPVSAPATPRQEQEARLKSPRGATSTASSDRATDLTSTQADWTDSTGSHEKQHHEAKAEKQQSREMHEDEDEDEDEMEQVRAMERLGRLDLSTIVSKAGGG